MNVFQIEPSLCSNLSQKLSSLGVPNWALSVFQIESPAIRKYPINLFSEAFYDAVLAPTWSGLKWLGGHIATVAQHLGHAVAWAAERSWNVMRSWGAWAWQGMEYVGRNAYHKAGKKVNLGDV